jgi:hypothetical protein
MTKVERQNLQSICATRVAEVSLITINNVLCF